MKYSYNGKTYRVAEINQPTTVFFRVTLLSPCYSIGGEIVMRLFVWELASECMRLSHFLLVGMVQTTVFAQSLSNFTHKFFKIKKETLSILGH